ncbi:MAG: CGNR zinc finger domain-containing protein [Actinomycetota bacterium]|nr:CGNR zinc finger domain-containing protein [Actinomycetota bacterium]
MELSSYGDLAVRLVNTADPSRPGHDDLVDVEGLRALVGERPGWRAGATLADVRELRSLREKLRAVFEDVAAGHHAAAVDRLNALLAAAVVRPQISGHDDEHWHLHIFDDAPSVATAFTAAAVMGLAVQLTEVGPDRFGVCQSPPCRDVFVDTSTNRSRRYCSDRCATRANVAAYRARRRAAAAG